MQAVSSFKCCEAGGLRLGFFFFSPSANQEARGFAHIYDCGDGWVSASKVSAGWRGFRLGIK